MKEIARHIGFFTVYDNPGYSTEELRYLMGQGKRVAQLPHIKVVRICPNRLMAGQKLLMAQAVYPTIDNLVITNQTDTPSDDETSFSGTIYTTTAADEFSRSEDTNPYEVQWSINSESANGDWGSFILRTSAGVMINRALAGITKASGANKIVQFTGRVT